MARPSKTIGKNKNSNFTTRNNKQEIFSSIAKSTKTKEKLVKEPIGELKSEVDKTDA